MDKKYSVIITILLARLNEGENNIEKLLRFLSWLPVVANTPDQTLNLT